MHVNEQDVYLEDFETGNIEDTNEILSFAFGIKCFIGTFDQPAENAKVDLDEIDDNHRFI